MSHSQATEAAHHGTGVPARVLLAEDDRELRELLAFVLREDGHDVVEAENGVDLLAILNQPQSSTPAFDVVISDVRMPGLTAFEVLSRVQRALTDTAVILITAFGDAATHLKALTLGANRVFDKPFDFDELRDAVQETLRLSRRAS